MRAKKKARAGKRPSRRSRRKKRKKNSPRSQEFALTERKAIVGLGNPGRKYRHNRHNIGYMVLENVADKWNVRWRGSRRTRTDSARYAGNEGEIILAKPRTFMNCAGTAVAALATEYGISPDRMLVVYDEIDLAYGRLRFKPEGSSGGHKGMQSVIESLHTAEIPRLRIGIGRGAELSVSEYVLSDFTADERSRLTQIVTRAGRACIDWAVRGNEFVMQAYNRKHKTENTQ
ncbi:MAG: aminoacyl-tRNA hydrolase [Candidatus Omnitrophica bacterium]|nr:aminoacyl-tRNA hydrolase [Candidatus Omnitrophota bacterium]